MKERAAPCAICFANDIQLSEAGRKQREYTAGTLLEAMANYASRMTAGIHPMTRGLMVHLTDEQEPNLDLVIKEVTIPQDADPVTFEPDWGDAA